MNPDGLPVGFVAGQGTGRTWLGMSCAACHTAEIRLGIKAYRVDGGPTGGDVQAFLTDLTLALQQTQTDPAKFGRFATKILKGPQNTPANQVELKAQLGVVIKARVGYNLRNFLGTDQAQITTGCSLSLCAARCGGGHRQRGLLSRRQGRGPHVANRGHETCRCACQLSVSLGHSPAQRGAVAGHRQERRSIRYPHPVAQRRRGRGGVCRFRDSR